MQSDLNRQSECSEPQRIAAPRHTENANNALISLMRFFGRNIHRDALNRVRDCSMLRV